MIKRSIARGSRRIRRATVAVLVALAGMAHFASAAEAQQLRHGSSGGEITRKVDSILPRSGAPGSTVRVKSGSMPSITPIRVGFGATAGFEELRMLLTSLDGEFSMSATVPSWATWDKSYRFIVFDAYFRPVAMSAPFYATNSDGLLYREGTVSRENPACVTLRELNGEIHALSGELAALKTGDYARIEGTFGGDSGCSTGIAIKVTRIRPRTSARDPQLP
jgi:hypothetical protein